MLTLLRKNTVWILFAVYVVVYFISCLPYGHHGDFHYSYFNESRSLTDWHPLWMKIKLNAVADLFFSPSEEIAKMTLVMGLYSSILWIGSHVLMIKNLIYLKRSPYLYLVMLFFVNCLWGNFFSIMGADIGFFIQLYFLIALIYYSLLRKWSSKLLCILLMLFLWDTITWRHQALLLLPLFLWYIFKLYPKSASWGMLRLTTTVIALSSLFILATRVLYYDVLNAQKTSSEHVMMFSDLENISILRNDFSFKEKVKDEVGIYLYPWTDLELVPKGSKTLYQTTGVITANPKIWFQNSGHYDMAAFPKWIREVWMQSIVKHPKEFLEARVINYAQLLYMGVLPSPFRAYMSKYYPDVKLAALSELCIDTNSAVLTHLRDPYTEFKTMRRNGASLPHIALESSRFRLSLLKFLAVPLYSFIYLSLIVAVPLLWLVKRMRENTDLDFTRLCVGSSVIYLIGFIPFVPSADIRFTTPPMVIAVLGLAVFMSVYPKLRCMSSAKSTSC